MDIDIDLPSYVDATEVFDVIRASTIRNDELVAHPCGTYFQTIPTDKETGLSSIEYKAANKLGIHKVDFLHLSLLDDIESKQHLRALMNREPEWNSLQNSEIVSKLFQLRNHINILKKIKPTNINELADCIAIIRPNKRQYLEQYVENKEVTRPKLYRTEDEDKSSFKKCHAISYALTVVAQLNLMKEQNVY